MKQSVILSLAFLFLLGTATIPAAAQDDVDDALGFQYYQQGQYQEAAILFEKLFSKTKSDTYFDFYYNSLIKLKKLEEAEKIVRKLVKQNPKNTHYTLALGRLYQEKGQEEDANKLFIETISNLPADEFKVRGLANLFYSFQAYDLAITTFLQGRKLLNNDQLFSYELLSIYRFKKDKNMLVQEYIQALAAMPDLLLQAENVLATVFEENTDYQSLQGALLKKIQKAPQTEVYHQLLIWSYMQQQEYEMALRQLLAQDKRTKDDGTILFNAASTFIANKAYGTAIKAYEYLLTKGSQAPYFLPAGIEMIDAKYQLTLSGQVDKKAIEALAAEYENILQEYGKTPRTIFALKKMANLQASYLGQPGKAEKSLEDALAVPGISAADIGQIKLDLGDLYIQTQQPWEAFLVYEQVARQFEAQPIGNEAHYRSARLSFYQGNFKYAKSQADVLKASTSQLIANDALNLSLLVSDNLQSPADSSALKMYADAELLQFRKQFPDALSKLDSIATAYPGNSLADDILMARSRIYIARNDISSAAKALRELIEQQDNSIWTDDALFTLADIYEKNLKNTEEARVLYQKLINEHPGSMFAAEARKRFRKLRGDNIGT